MVWCARVWEGARTGNDDRLAEATISVVELTNHDAGRNAGNIGDERDIAGPVWITAVDGHGNRTSGAKTLLLALQGTGEVVHAIRVRGAVCPDPDSLVAAAGDRDIDGPVASRAEGRGAGRPHAAIHFHHDVEFDRRGENDGVHSPPRVPVTRIAVVMPPAERPVTEVMLNEQAMGKLRRRLVRSRSANRTVSIPYNFAARKRAGGNGWSSAKASRLACSAADHMMAQVRIWFAIVSV